MTAKNNGFNYQDGVSLKEYVDRRLVDLKDSIEQARISMEKRLDGMNEFRDTLRDQANTFISKGEYGTRHDELTRQLGEVRDWKNTQVGKASQTDLNATRTLTIVSLVIGLLGLLVAMAKAFAL